MRLDGYYWARYKGSKDWQPVLVIERGVFMTGIYGPFPETSFDWGERIEWKP